MRALIFDLVALGGLVLLIYGAGLIYTPLGWLTAGLVLVAVGFWGAWICGRKRRAKEEGRK